MGFFFIAPEIRAILIAPLFTALRASGQTMQVQALSPAETITTDMKLSVIAALAVSAPWLLYQLWKFVAPGLYAHERRYVHFLTPLSGVLTACGMALFYWVLLPFTLLFLVSFGAARARTVPEPKVAAVTAPDGTASAESSGGGERGGGRRRREFDRGERDSGGKNWRTGNARAKPHPLDRSPNQFPGA